MRRAEYDRLIRKQLRGKVRKKRPRPQGPSHLEHRFDALWRTLGGPELRREYRFHQERRWKFDFAHPKSRVAIEIEGGVFMRRRNRHTSPTGFVNDCEKYNTATLMGWQVIRLPEPQLTEEWLNAIKQYIHDRLQGQDVGGPA